jgi:LuxR family maltose regulon positive regulatory protein
VPRGLIVLDDAHRIADPAVFEFLDAMLERMPSHWSLLVASRIDPPLALARLRARGDLAELRQDDLSFSRDDVQALLRARDVAWNEPQLQQLIERTQGWAAGVSLALSRGIGPSGAPAGSLRDRHVFDYLASEVLDALPPVLRGFLLRCSVLPELGATRCAALTGREGVRAAARGNRAPGPLRVGARRGARRERSVPARPVPRLPRGAAAHRAARRAARAAAARRRHRADLVRRIGYLARAGDWPVAEQTLYTQGPALLARGAVVPLLRLIEQFPPALRERSPLLAHLRGLCAWAHWDLVTMCRSLDQAAAGHLQRGDTGAAQRAQVLVVLGLAAAVR